MRISETLELSITDDMDINKLERYLAREIKSFGKQVFGKVPQEIEMKKPDEAKGKVGVKEVLVVGSGGVEKNIDLALCRRFKGRGMSWSRAGAQNLLKLRLLRYDRKDWRAYWRRRAN